VRQPPLPDPHTELDRRTQRTMNEQEFIVATSHSPLTK
jgi:hypothetical protein